MFLVGVNKVIYQIEQCLNAFYMPTIEQMTKIHKFNSRLLLKSLTCTQEHGIWKQGALIPLHY